MFRYGAELEFYIKSASYSEIRQALDGVSAFFSIIPIDLKKEEGEGQYEVVLPPIDNQEVFIEITENIRYKLIDLGCDISTMPFENQLPSSMQLSISLQNHDENIFQFALAGVLEKLPEMLKIFNPLDSDKLRYNYKSVHTATKICWGINNRSVAVRVVNHENGTKRIEFRVISNNANIRHCMDAIHNAMLYGINQKQKPANPVYGNANDDQYKLPLIIDYL